MPATPSSSATRTRRANALEGYARKRDFSKTPEPSDLAETSKAHATTKPQALSFVVQKHWASSLHYDFRLELDGVLLSWAVPKGPSLDPTVRRMAIHVEDHPLSYGAFEGTIPAAQYGAGRVIVWDRGTWEPQGSAQHGLRDGKLAFELHGEKLAGRWELVRMKRGEERQEAWLLFKKNDEWARPASDFDVTVAQPDSVISKASEGVAPVASQAVDPARRAPRKDTSTQGHRARPAAKRSAVASTRVQLSSPDRVIDELSGARKIDLFHYYEQVADWLLPHLKSRPVSLVRAPSGIGGALFFQKHDERDSIQGVIDLDPALWPGYDALMEVRTRKALLGSAQMNVVEFHTWNAKVPKLDNPDRMIFDLDPGEGVPWAQMQEAAQLTRALLVELGLEAWLKTSGGKGLHVVVPLAPKLDSEAVKTFSHEIVQHLAETLPMRFVAKSGPSHRVGKIFVDYLRNGLGQTTAAAFSVRARPGLGVSMPIDWEELDRVESGSHWTIANALEHLARRPADPWAGYSKCRQSLGPAMKRLARARPDGP